jgi:hypothetical protein
VDATFVKENYTGTTGVVAHNSNCCFIWAVCSWLPNVGSTLEEEAESIRKDVQMLPRRAFTSVIVETDSSTSGIPD